MIERKLFYKCTVRLCNAKAHNNSVTADQFRATNSWKHKTCKMMKSYMYLPGTRDTKSFLPVSTVSANYPKHAIDTVFILAVSGFHSAVAVCFLLRLDRVQHFFSALR